MERPVVRRTACTRDCPDACEILASWDGERITRLQGAPDHPVTRGFLCERTSRFLERQYAADRLQYPLRRDGTEFRRATWDEALDAIAQALVRIRAESGGAAVLNYRCGGSLGIAKTLTDHFFEQWGPVTEKSGDVCCGAGEAAQMTDFGLSDSHDLFDLQNSRTIVMWGKNVFTSNVHLLPVLRQARAQGTRLILIDPVHQRTASLCDFVVQPRPGGDVALAFGMARALAQAGAIDPEGPTYCDHWDAYWDVVQSQTVEQWAAAADVAPAELDALATAYAQGPAAILVGWGLQRRTYGATTVRAIDALAAVSGNLGIRGGGVSFYFRRRGAFDFSFRTHRTARTIPEPLLGAEILRQDSPAIRAVWISSANPVAMLPDSQTVDRALRSRELTVVVDSFLTDTARCADWVLPSTTFLEEEDLVGAYGHHWLANVEPVAPAWGESRSDFQIIQELAQRMNCSSFLTGELREWKERFLTRVAPHGITLDRLAQGAMRNPFAEHILFADRKFPTSSGKVNLLHELPSSLCEPAPPELRLAAFSTPHAQSAQWPASHQVGPAQVTVHPSVVPDAVEGDLALLRSASGELTVRLHFDPRQRPDSVLMEKGGWLSAGRCANALIEAQLTDDGEGAVYYDTQVTLRRVASSG